MVDLHQVQPGLPDGHPWKLFSRWQMVWRVFLGVALSGMCGTLILSLSIAGTGSAVVLGTFLPYLWVGVLPLICAVLVPAFGPWLVRYYPFSQALIFGAIAAVAVSALGATLSFWEWILRGPCPPDTYCGGPFDSVLLLLVLCGLPVYLTACVGFGIALWSPTVRGRKVFWPLFCGVTAIFAVVMVIANR